MWTGIDVVGLGGLTLNGTGSGAWFYRVSTGQVGQINLSIQSRLVGPVSALGFDGGRVRVVFSPYVTQEWYCSPCGPGYHGDAIRSDLEETFQTIPIRYDDSGGGPALEVDGSWYTRGGVRGACFSWGGSYGFRFGGWNEFATGDPFTNRIRWEENLPPAYAHPRFLESVLPGNRSDCTAVWTGESVYVFGGRNSTGAFRDILRFDVLTHEVSPVQTLLPFEGGLWNSTGIWDGRFVYLFGGETNRGNRSDLIFRFDPLVPSVTVEDLRLPSPRSSAAAVLASGASYVIGGMGAKGTLLDEVFRFEPRPHAAENAPPVANFSVRFQPGKSDCVAGCFFSADTSYDPDGPIASYEWEFGDGSAPEKGSWSWHYFPSEGSFTVRLKVRDHVGGYSEFTREIVTG